MILHSDTPSVLVKEILDRFDGTDILDLRIHSLFTGNYTDPAYRAGNWGFLPLAGLATGDLLVLGYRQGKPLAQWDLMGLSQNGDGASTFGSSLGSFVSTYLA
ncbi:MAG: hypothetical protein ACRCUT_10390, partial [Spirochaetota bacterium]